MAMERTTGMVNHPSQSIEEGRIIVHASFDELGARVQDTLVGTGQDRGLKKAGNLQRFDGRRKVDSYMERHTRGIHAKRRPRQHQECPDEDAVNMTGMPPACRGLGENIKPGLAEFQEAVEVGHWEEVLAVVGEEDHALPCHRPESDSSGNQRSNNDGRLDGPHNSSSFHEESPPGLPLHGEGVDLGLGRGDQAPGPGLGHWSGQAQGAETVHGERQWGGSGSGTGLGGMGRQLGYGHKQRRGRQRGKGHREGSAQGSGYTCGQGYGYSHKGGHRHEETQRKGLGQVRVYGQGPRQGDKLEQLANWGEDRAGPDDINQANTKSYSTSYPIGVVNHASNGSESCPYTVAATGGVGLGGVGHRVVSGTSDEEWASMSDKDALDAHIEEPSRCRAPSVPNFTGGSGGRSPVQSQPGGQQGIPKEGRLRKARGDCHETPVKGRLPPDQLNEGLVKTESDLLLFSKKARPIEYTPCTLKEYRDRKFSGYMELGKLQPDLQTEELVAKRANAERFREFYRKLRKINQ
ncbi:unnamed protein product [Discosporangium mesarthrocarpum]